jgi:hypothetical protein
MRHTMALFVFIAALAGSRPAEAKHFRYLSRHPMPGGFCGITAPHMHKYSPPDLRAYRVVRGDYYFVGDPVPFGYEGPRYAYYGVHPVVEASVAFGEPLYCYLEGPHFHWYAPPPATHFEIRSGVNWYVGAFEPIYFEHRPRYVVVNEVYRPIQYQRPRVVVADAPPAWRGNPPPRHEGGWRGSPPPSQNQGWRGTPPPAPPPPSQDPGWRGTPPPSQQAGWRGSPPPNREVVVVPPAGVRPAAPIVAAPPPPSRERVIAVPPGQAKHEGRDDHDNDRGHGQGHDRGHGHNKGGHGRK